MTIVTRDSLQAMINSADEAKQIQIIGRALVVLFNRQTNAEKQENTTANLNGIGFTGADGKQGCLSAKFFLKHGTLQDWCLAKWLKPGKSGYSRITKYHAQLNEAAEEKRRGE